MSAPNNAGQTLLEVPPDLRGAYNRTLRLPDDKKAALYHLSLERGTEREVPEGTPRPPPGQERKAHDLLRLNDFLSALAHDSYPANPDRESSDAFKARQVEARREMREGLGKFIDEDDDSGIGG